MATSAVGTPASSVFVGNLAYDLSEQDVIDYFSQVGPVKSARIVTDKETGKPRGFGFVEFHDIATAESSVRNLNGTELNSRTLKVVFAENNAIDKGGDDAGIRRLFPNKPVGVHAVMHAGRGMGETLGATFEPDPDANKVISLLARKNKNEMYEYLAQVQKYSAEHPVQARELLANNPQLCQAIFIIEILLGLVGNPLGDQAPDMNLGGVGVPAPIDPRKAAMPVPAPPPPMTSAPRPMVSMSHVSPPGAPAAVPGMTSDQQQALLQQVMSLTPEQIDLLPPQQKSQVLALQQSLRQN